MQCHSGLNDDINARAYELDFGTSWRLPGKCPSIRSRLTTQDERLRDSLGLSAGKYAE